MNIFEDLIDELKEENLLEETVTETHAAKEKAAVEKHVAEQAAAEQIAAKQLIAEQLMAEQFAAEQFAAEQLMAEQFAAEQFAAEQTAAEQFAAAQIAAAPPNFEMLAETAAVPPPTAAEKEASAAEFYRQRAMDEVSFLQRVEQVFAGVERDQLKVLPSSYDEWEVKKVLHAFLQISHEPQSSEHAQAQFRLLQETENWHSSLAVRDKRIMTAHLRRYCETSRPALSSPALISLARFYRNSSYSEQVRSKFDLAVTRLFSKEIFGSRRETIFSRQELADHCVELYAEWSSALLYPTDADNALVVNIVREFESFMREAARAQTFDELIKNDFFNRLHLFKEGTNENFFAPVVMAAAVECNVSIGNRYIELLEIEKKQGNTADLENRHGIAHDQMISEATGKTFALVELLHQKNIAPPVAEKVLYHEPEIRKERAEPPVKVEPIAAVENASGYGKWMVIAAVIAVLLVASIMYVGKSSSSEEAAKKEAATTVPTMTLDHPVLQDNLQQAEIKNGTLNGVVLSDWNDKNEESKKNILKQMLKVGDAKGFNRIELTDKDKKSVASAADGSVFILD